MTALRLVKSAVLIYYDGLLILPMKSLRVPEHLDGERIDTAAAELMNAYSRTQVQRMIRKGLVYLNGKEAKKGNRVATDDELSWRPLPVEESKFEAKDIPLDIIYEDEDLLIVNKPAGLLTHPSAHERQETLVNALLHHCGDRLSGIGGEKRPGIVHRLDKDTSGILMVAKHDESHKDLAKQIQERRVEKHYLTLVLGEMDSPSGTIDAPIMKSREQKDHRVRITPHKDAKDSLTHFWVKEDFDRKYSLLDVQIITGRMHQIRVHLSAIHHPVAGDPLYGNRKTNGALAKIGLKRQFLHAFSLKFRHPRTQEWVQFEAPLPEDLQTVLDTIRRSTE